MISWNDRRKAKKAASNTMKTTLGQMAKTGALRGTTPPDKNDRFGMQKHDAEMERGAVRREALNLQGMNIRMDRGSAYKEAARRVDRDGKK
jgi:hypothetical protein